MQHSSGSGSGDGDYPSPPRQPKEMYVGSCGLWLLTSFRPPKPMHALAIPGLLR